MPHGRARAHVDPAIDAEDRAGAKVTLMGLGGFGGGVGAASWLADQGADVLVTDLRPPDELEPSLSALATHLDAGRITLRLGEHNVSDFTTADLIVANPAVPRPWENRFLRAAQAAGIEVTTEIRLLVERLPRRDRVIAVTGTAGKSTTSAMIHRLLQAAGVRAHLGGNLGGSLLPQLEHIEPIDWIVLELSSAQLHWLAAGAGHPDQPGWSPGIGVVTNLAPNHLDWHGAFDHYASSKRQLIRNQVEGDHLVLPAALLDWANAEGAVRPQLRTIAPTDSSDLPSLAIPGAHNRRNAACATAAIQCAGMSPRAGALSTFKGLPHRLQFVGEIPTSDGGCARAFNDSKCTTPEAAALAVSAFTTDQGEAGEARVHLICGGYDKQVDLAPLIEAGARCGHCYTVGATGGALAGAIGARGGAATHAERLDEAVAGAIGRLRSDEVLLLAPGCASWDQFKSYEERGDRFTALIRAAGGAPVVGTTATT